MTRLGGLWSSLVAAKRRPTPQQIVAAEAETSSGAFKKGIIIGALRLFQPTFALKLIIATETFLDVRESSSQALPEVCKGRWERGKLEKGLNRDFSALVIPPRLGKAKDKSPISRWKESLEPRSSFSI